MQTICDTQDVSFCLLSSKHFLLDIETTGLSKTNHRIICIGVMYRKSAAEISSIRWLSETAQDELTLLESFLVFCSSYKAVYTYSGNLFDIPFIVSRLTYHKLTDTVFKSLAFIDMKKLFSKINSKRHVIEKHLCFTRKTTLNGKELVKLFILFESTGLAAYGLVILDHNLDELRSLSAMYEAHYIVHHLQENKLLKVIMCDEYLTIHLETSFRLSTSFSVTTSDMHLQWLADTSFVILEILLHKDTFKKYLSPAKDYYFIQDQNQLMHKSVAQFIPKELRQKVTSKQCFIVKTSVFIKLYTTFKVNKTIWYNKHEESFIEYQNEENEGLVPIILNQLVYLLTH
jgi:DNA polymerase elongation subunit (family B)